MQYFTFEIVIEKEPDDEGYLAYSPTLPGCFSNGRSIEDVKRSMRQAIQQHLESLLEHGGVEAAPDPTAAAIPENQLY